MHNEEGNLRPFFDRASATLSQMGARWELIFVNDGSSDNSLNEAVELHKMHGEIKVVDLSRNFGKEIALSAGLEDTPVAVVQPDQNQKIGEIPGGFKNFVFKNKLDKIKFIHRITHRIN